MHVVLISPYEIGRQPFGLAEMTAWCRKDGHAVTCLDLSLEKLDMALVGSADLIGIYVGMHTATRIAIEAIAKIATASANCPFFVYGLYGPVNATLFRSLGARAVFGGEYENALRAFIAASATGNTARWAGSQVPLTKVDFVVPERLDLPALNRYAHLILPDGTTKTVGFAESSRGCKHTCRHCPVVPVYKGKFRAVPHPIVLQDIRNQVTMGAQHISFGDPDFLNGPTHALKIVQAMHAEFPDLTFDATIKIEHLLSHHRHLRTFKDCGCLFIVSAVESVDDEILDKLDKGHTRADFLSAVALLREVGIDMAPTFVPFTPWSTLENYVALLRDLVALDLVHNVPTVQLIIRLLIPAGSYLLELPGFDKEIEPYDPTVLGYPSTHHDPRVDELQRQVQAFAEMAEGQGLSRLEAFAGVWSLAHNALGLPTPILTESASAPIARLSEPWYCCAEPTNAQLEAI